MSLWLHKPNDNVTSDYIKRSTVSQKNQALQFILQK